MTNRTRDMMTLRSRSSTPSEHAARALVLSNRWEKQGLSNDTKSIRQAVQSGKDGLDAVPSVPSGGSGKEAGELMVVQFHDQDLRFRWCPPGNYKMGSPPAEVEWFDFEDQVEVRLTRGFWIAEVPVTQGLWNAADGPKLDWSTVGEGRNLPATNMSHYEAVEFAASLTAKLRETSLAPTRWKLSLPTEAQWEYAARAGTKTRYPWGDERDRLACHAWYWDNSEGKPHEVATLSPNDWGVHDTLGNVWEWCLDAWSDRLPGGDDPFVESTCSSYRVVRGGSWNDHDAICRPANRDWEAPGSRLANVGFRLAMIKDDGDGIDQVRH